MFSRRLPTIIATSVLVAMTSVSSAVEFRLVGFGPVGEEKPRIVEAQGRVHDLSTFIDDITPDHLLDGALEGIEQIPIP
jgi:hypothetical protein